MNYNRVILAGRLTRDPELRCISSGTALCTFGLAINRKWKDKEETCFVDCTAWGKTAEMIRTHVRKGRELLVEGRLKLEQWDAPDGQKRSKLGVVVENFQFVGAKDQPDAKETPY